MARQNTIQVLQTTRANLNAQATLGNLIVGEPYFITDEQRFAIASSPSAYTAHAKQGESSSINNSNWSGTSLSVTNGGTGSTTPSGALTNLGLSTLGKELVSDSTGADMFSTMGASQSFGSTAGTVTLPNGFIIKWGRTSGQGSKTFPAAFPTACVSVQTNVEKSGSTGVVVAHVPTISRTAFSVVCNYMDTAQGTPTAAAGETYRWVAFGY